jgi:hypothetical protein
LLAAYVLVVGDSHIGQGWRLWVHLATNPHATPHQVSAHHHDDHEPGHRHGSERHEHPAHPSSDAHNPQEASPATIPLIVPHEHDGKVHTHEQSLAEEPVLLTVTLSKHYVSSPPFSTPAARGPSQGLHML